ncbi:hypothetical protein [Brevibacterium luteolum]|uniref:hypothetical protein n=1 Tax=Brevibacterium luteolum TaxID=199591 RepID=UPI00223C4BA0|nr:hypothetical protein [Brevibacterium luteolum]MCT1873223.1 hypothetical protein [Brevibacterium luteolum]MCT1890342.1 hypothetical protein [Brevibacterium luteolum]MCT1893782.1 hypothetical protein [Brevibacterium luteolum]MCT1924579.1 hypothetical protein [Brevibacterium luteolum]
MATSSVPMMFTGEEGATRALGAALCERRDFALSWLRNFGIDATDIISVHVETPYATSNGKRRADVSILAACAPPRDGSAYSTDDSVREKKIIIEAKVDALVDYQQLVDAREAADHVICLIPSDIPLPQEVDGIDVHVETWEDLASAMVDAKDDVLAFFACQFRRTLGSPRIRRRRMLAALTMTASLPEAWTAEFSGQSSSGNSLSIFFGPDRDSHYVRVEVANEQANKGQTPYAYVLVCSETSATDTTVARALRSAILPEPAADCIRIRKRRKRQNYPVGQFLEESNVPKERTWGYGQKQLDKHDWCGFGVVVDLTREDYSEIDGKRWLDYVLNVGQALDLALRDVLHS